MDKNPLEFDVLTDPENGYAEALGIRFRLPDYLIELYDKRFGLKLPAFHGDKSWTLPMPARFIVDSHGVIRFAEVNADYTVRPEPEDTLERLRSIVF